MGMTETVWELLKMGHKEEYTNIGFTTCFHTFITLDGAFQFMFTSEATQTENMFFSEMQTQLSGKCHGMSICDAMFCAVTRGRSAEASAAQDAALHPEQTDHLPPAVPGKV